MNSRTHPLAAVSSIFGSLLTVALLIAPVVLRDSMAAAPDPPGPVDFMKSPPPEHLASVVIKADATVVGFILPADIRPGDQISGTAVLMPAGAGADAAASGEVEVQTPDGKRHQVRNGSVITFMAPAGGAFALLNAEHVSAASAVCPMASAGVAPHPISTPRGPMIVQNNAAVTLPISSDGAAANINCTIGGVPARIIAAKPGEAVVVPQGISKPGPTPIEAEYNGQKSNMAGWSIATVLTAPPNMHIGSKGMATLHVNFGGAPKTASGAPAIYSARVTNLSPTVVRLNGGKVAQTYTLDTGKLNSEGVCEVSVPFTALTAGKYSVNSHVSLSEKPTAEGCHLTCTGCEGSHYLTYYAFCNDAGTVNCYGTNACGGGCGGHRAVGGPCGFWLCACSWGKCHCK